ncbi:MAG: Gfo/Idh/MocA family oxidoreductase [Magnetococcales bacterium]|nr:Gfo/Idh/MocA family oxidoreductase [Magnetococcales bacterium]
MTLRYALIGVSGIAPYYVKRLARLPGAELVVVQSRSPERARTFAENHGIPAHTADLESILNDPGVDALLILTEPARHGEIALRGAAAGKHLLLEKPVDLDPAPVEALLAAVRNTSLVVGVVSPWRFDPVMREMREALRAPEAQGARLAQLMIMSWRDRSYYERGSGWRLTGSPVMVNQAIHGLDLLHWFFGAPVGVHAASRISRPFLGCSDQSAALLEYADGTLALVGAGTFSRGRHGPRFTVWHPGGVLDYDALMGPSPPSGWRERLGRWVAGQPRWGRPVVDGMARVLEDFTAAVREGRPPAAGLEDGLAALQLALRISEARK